MKPRIAITAGDPAGIGPEIASRAAEDVRVRDVCEPIVYGPPPGATFPPGVLSAAAGRAAYDTIVRAVDDARSGEVAAIATAPINKEAFRLAGLPWSGHTDLLAHLTGPRPPPPYLVSHGTDHRADRARAATLRQGRAAHRGRGAQPTCGRARIVRRRGDRRQDRKSVV